MKNKDLLTIKQRQFIRQAIAEVCYFINLSIVYCGILLFVSQIATNTRQPDDSPWIFLGIVSIVFLLAIFWRTTSLLKLHHELTGLENDAKRNDEASNKSTNE